MYNGDSSLSAIVDCRSSNLLLSLKIRCGSSIYICIIDWRFVTHYKPIGLLEFESPFVLRMKYGSGMYIYIIHWRFVTREYFSQKNIEFESPFVLVILYTILRIFQ